ncbi:MAG: type II toxin-antitoxin system RelE/ParE family toxin, partial [Actinomycetota bacterium]|nr:type II toxin-antitoxin system RelE/ParE family toxin [Actinomycetota bacterium]
MAGYFSARRGAYRVVYSITDDPALIRVMRIDTTATPTAGSCAKGA